VPLSSIGYEVAERVKQMVETKGILGCYEKWEYKRLNIAPMYPSLPGVGIVAR